MQNIQLNLNTQETNVVLNALSKQPYSQVYKLIANIQQQGQSQLNSVSSPPKASTKEATTTSKKS